MERVNKAGTKFDFEKIKWFNQQYIKDSSREDLARSLVADLKDNHSIICDISKAIQIVELLRERITFPHELASKALILFNEPSTYDEKVVNKKWNKDTAEALLLFANVLEEEENITADGAKTLFWTTLEGAGYKPGQFMQMLRLSLTGESSGPDLMTMIEILSPSESAKRIKKMIEMLS